MHQSLAITREALRAVSKLTILISKGNFKTRLKPYLALERKNPSGLGESIRPRKFLRMSSFISNY